MTLNTTRYIPRSALSLARPLVLCLLLAGCVTPTAPSAPPADTTAGTPSGDTFGTVGQGTNSGVTLAQFNAIAAQVEPVAEATCRARQPGLNCDLRIVVDTRAGLPANAYQTFDQSGRPLIGFTLKMLDDLRNADEVAFVLGHEAAHHIQGHIPRSQQNALLGALVATGIGLAAGADGTTLSRVQDVGAHVGARSYSKAFELDADRLGTIIAKRAGFDPVRGAAFFTRIPDPGNRFLGSHPPNSDRLSTVRAQAAQL